MTSDLRASIESYLIEHARWVPARELVERFRLADDRDLRATGKTPGVLSRCAVSSSEGFKHLKHTTVLERIQYKNRQKRRHIAAWRALKWHNEGIAAGLDQPRKFEALTGQGRLL